MRKYLLFTLMVLMFVGIYSLNSQTVGNITKTFDDRGVVSSVFYWVPFDYDAANAYPFLLAWHGAGDGGSNMRSIVTYILAQRINAVLACPDANKVNGKAVDYFTNLLDSAYNYALANYNIDAKKKVIMGFSWGGAFSYQMGLLNVDRFVGIFGHAPAIGSLTQPQWDNILKIRMATILGDKDFNYAAVNSLMNSITAKGANLLYLIKPNVVHADNAYFNSQAIIDDYRQCYQYVIGEPLSAEENSFADNVSPDLFPVPANDFLNIKIDESYGIKINDIMIFNTAGELIKRMKTEPDYKQKISVSELSSGSYIIVINSRKNTIIRDFIITR